MLLAATLSLILLLGGTAHLTNDEDTKTAYMYLDANNNPYVSEDYTGTTVATGVFRDTIHQDGFTYLSLTTDPGYDDAVQAYCAGYLEGYLTQKQLEDAFYNLGLDELIADIKSTKKEVGAFMLENYEYMKKTISAIGSTNTFWYQVNLQFFQLKGIEDGYHNNAGKVMNDIEPFSRVWINSYNLEIYDLFAKFGYGTQVLGSGSCSAMIKFLGDDLITTHVTWGSYVNLLRVLKSYTMPYRFSEAIGDSVPATTVVFSSYPGQTTSGDDYYITNQKLTVLETTNDVYNHSLYQYVVPENTVPYFLKIVVSNRLATSGESWSNLFSKYNMGTYNNQWMVVDYKQFSPNSVGQGTLWVLEQLPGTIVAKDLSQQLLEEETQYAWTSYNVPYFKEIQKLDMLEIMVAKFGPFFSYNHNPRANMFRRDLYKAVDVNSSMSLMRYNDFMNDPFAACNCQPLNASGENGISARSDLNPLDGTYEIAALGARCHGGTDLKITNVDMMAHLQMVAISGPTHEEQPVFDWGQQEKTACVNVSHRGHPERFDFPPVLVTF